MALLTLWMYAGLLNSDSSSDTFDYDETHIFLRGLPSNACIVYIIVLQEEKELSCCQYSLVNWMSGFSLAVDLGVLAKSQEVQRYMLYT